MIPSFDFGLFEDLREKIQAQEPLIFEDGLRLYRSSDLPTLGALAQIVRKRLHGQRVFYSVNLHVNYTNVCSTHCSFCAFSKDPSQEESYTLSPDEIGDKVRRGIGKQGINEAHIVGGHNPWLDFEYYLEVLRIVRRIGPELYIKAYTAPEIDLMARREGISYEQVLMRLKEAGLDGLPGGGAEIFSPATRQKICPDKITADEWLEIHRLAHNLGIRTNATMLYGHIESDEDRVDHVLRLRELQNQTHGFYAFVPLAYNAENSPMKGIGECGGYLDLKVFAVSRLLLHNIPHLKVHWVTTGMKLAQIALSFGVDDVGGTNLEEEIVHDAGSKTPRDMNREELEHLIRAAGYEPCLVNSSYEYEFEPSQSFFKKDGSFY